MQWQPPSNARGTNAADYDTPSATNPCSALVNIFVQMPGGSQLISSLQNGAGVTTPQNLIIQPCPTNEQGENVLQPQQQAGMTQVFAPFDNILPSYRSYYTVEYVLGQPSN